MEVYPCLSSVAPRAHRSALDALAGDPRNLHTRADRASRSPGTPARDVEAVRTQALTYRTPDYAGRARSGLPTCGRLPVTETWSRTGEGLAVSRVVPNRALRLLDEHRIPHAIADDAVAAPRAVMPNANALRQSQVDALEQLLRLRVGPVQMPTGSGKTNIALSVVSRLQTTALILTHTRELLRQTVARCESWPGISPGVLRAGRWDARPTSVAMIQTLARRGVEQIPSKFGAVWRGEAHHAPARTLGSSSTSSRPATSTASPRPLGEKMESIA